MDHPLTGKPLGCGGTVDPNNWQLAHIQNKRMYGDTLENVVTKHPHCHMVIEHAYGNRGKIIPRKR